MKITNRELLAQQYESEGINLRAPVTQNEKDASVFTAEDVKSATVTVNLTNGYYNQDVNAKNEYYKPKDDTFTMADVVKTYDVKNSSRDLNDAEKNSAACAVIDNNRWMVSQINDTYLYAQVMQDLMDNLDISDDEAADIAGKLIANPGGYMNHGEYGNYAKKIAGVAGAEPYCQYDYNVRADQISPELIEATEFVLPDDEKNDGVYTPNLNTMVSNKKSGNEELSETVTFDPKDIGELSFSEDEKKLYEAARDNGTTKQFIQNWIAAKYGLGELQDDGSFRYYDSEGNLVDTEGCDTTADLINSYAGVAILSAIAKEEGNNFDFDDMQEDPNAIIKRIADSIGDAIDDSNGEFTLYCPPVEINAMYNEGDIKDTNDDGKIDATDFKAAFVQERDKVGTITYIHTVTDSLLPKESDDKADGELTGMDVLDAYNMHPYGNMRKWAEERKNKLTQDDITLLLSMFEQIEANNPGMGNAVIHQSPAVFDELMANENQGLKALIPEGTDLKNLSDDEKKDYLAQFFNDDDALRESVLNSLSPDTKLKMYMYADYVGFINDSDGKQGGELSLKNIEYILQKDVKPTTPKPTPKPTNPPETPTEPEPTTPEPTTPEPTTPEPTTPEPTTPEPTTPEPTTPEPTCPSEPEVDPDPSKPEVSDPPIDPPPVETECPEVPDVEVSDTPVDPSEPELETPSETPTEPAPTEPAPTEPAPTEPAPTEPAPTEPAPTEPAPTEPAPTNCPSVGTEDGSKEEGKKQEDEEIEFP